MRVHAAMRVNHIAAHKFTRLFVGKNDRLVWRHDGEIMRVEMPITLATNECAEQKDKLHTYGSNLDEKQVDVK